jgi:hypothetical protein
LELIAFFPLKINFQAGLAINAFPNMTRISYFVATLASAMIPIMILITDTAAPVTFTAGPFVAKHFAN